MGKGMRKETGRMGIGLERGIGLGKWVRMGIGITKGNGVGMVMG